MLQMRHHVAFVIQTHSNEAVKTKKAVELPVVSLFCLAI